MMFQSENIKPGVVVIPLHQHNFVVKETRKKKRKRDEKTCTKKTK